MCGIFIDSFFPSRFQVRFFQQANALTLCIFPENPTTFKSIYHKANTLYHNADSAYNSVLWVGRMPEGEAATWSRYWVLSRPLAGGWGPVRVFWVEGGVDP